MSLAPSGGILNDYTPLLVHVCMYTGIVESLLLLKAFTDPYRIWLVVHSTQWFKIDGGSAANPNPLRLSKMAQVRFCFVYNV